MDSALKALFYALDKGATLKRTLFIGARMHPDMQGFGILETQQHFKPYAAELESAGKTPASGLEDCSGLYEQILVLSPKNAIEAAYHIANGIERLEPRGIITVAAGNKAGGTRLSALLSGFGMDIKASLSKHKSRIVIACKGASVDQSALDKALKTGRRQVHPQTGFTTQAGLFSWDRVDKGSALLTAHLPDTLSGRGADFGCGYGYLSCWMADNSANIISLACLDADKRALECVQANLQDVQFDVHPVWADLAQPNNELKNLDFVVMNPPFHEGKHSDPAMGQAFVRNVAAALKQGGVLWCVANAQLPYEASLRDAFQHVEGITQSGGFKIFKALK